MSSTEASPPPPPPPTPPPQRKLLPTLDIPTSSQIKKTPVSKEKYAVDIPAGATSKVTKEYSHIPHERRQSGGIALMFLLVIIGIVGISLLILAYELWTHPAWSNTIRKRLPNNIFYSVRPEDDPSRFIVPIAHDFELKLPDNYNRENKFGSPVKRVPWLPAFRNAKHGQEQVALRDGTKRTITWSVRSESRPRVLIINGTITPEEAQSLISTARKSLERSRVISGNNGENAANAVRTSSGMFLVREEEVNLPANQALRAVIAAVGGVPSDTWVEATQILEYKAGQHYIAHPDFYYEGDKANLNRGGQRIYTVLTWLNEVPSGGETTFPNAGLKVKPQPFHSIMFYNTDEHGNVDYSSMHSGEPPAEGSTKYVAVNWVHGMPFF